ncbi:hypothetical protein AJ79_09623 [Helicocarpus griseus UAMH5409]|uniref:Metallo-beta-lactamase domain-containing protein n=1 Tax=Helicocarpus griseus UAMH5409 TaxID=1447875 RepID=A0A2B7WIL8_9EURO|nr:hypothetical protein AJ79_09623 [Helicocarpus griseus UAMH5409]
MTPFQRLVLDPTTVKEPPTRDARPGPSPSNLPPATGTKLHPFNPGAENASLRFIGNATTVLEWEGIRLMTDPNFLHKGDHVHLGPGVTAERLQNPAVDLHELPRIDVVLLSHYHEDHFDRKVEDSLRRSLPIISTPHAKEHLSSKPGDGEAFTNVYALDTFQSMMVDIKRHDNPASIGGKGHKMPAMKVTAMPGKHVPTGIATTLNDFVKAVPPTNGWMLELGYIPPSPSVAIDKDTDPFECGYRIYISGDTLMVDELKEIPHRYQGQRIDLMLIHLGGTTIPSPSMPLLMVTMDAAQGIQLLQLVKPDVTIPIHFDDYNVFTSPLSDFEKAVKEAGLEGKVVYLDRQEDYRFNVKK